MVRTTTASNKKYHLIPFDVKTAGFDVEKDKICRLKKSLYGLKQAPQRWNKKFTEFMQEIGFEQTKKYDCIYSNGYICR